MTTTYAGTWTDTDNGIIYAWDSTDQNNKRARVIGRDPDPIYSSPDVTIRDTIEVNGVTWQVWFVGGFSDDTIIISMILPKFIKKIGVSAFNGAIIEQVDLSQCTLLNGVNTSCFANSNIKSIDMTNCSALKIIGAYTFNSCSGLTKVIMPHVTNLVDTAFSGAVPVVELNLNSMTTITSVKFSGIIGSSLKILSLNSVTALPPDIFNFFTLLEDLSLNAIPSITATTLNRIGSSLKIISLNSVTNLGLDPDTFSNYQALEELSLNSLTSFNLVTLTGGMPTLKKISLNSIINS